MFEFELKMALTISSAVNKKTQCVAIMFIKIFQNCLVRLSRYLYAVLPEYSEGYCRISTVTRLLLLFQSSEWPTCMALLAALLEGEGSVSDSGPY